MINLMNGEEACDTTAMHGAAFVNHAHGCDVDPRYLSVEI